MADNWLIFASDRRMPQFNVLAGVIPCQYPHKTRLQSFPLQKVLEVLEDLRKILPGCQQMANVPNGVKILQKTYGARTLQTDDRSTDGRLQSLHYCYYCNFYYLNYYY